MVAVDHILRRLSELGVTVDVNAYEVLVDHPDRIPGDLRSDLSRSKLDLFVKLTTERILTNNPDCGSLVKRLRAGHRWITQSAEILAYHPTHGEGSDRLPKTLRWTRVWLELDRHMREQYGYTGCILLETSCAAVGRLLCADCRRD